MHCILDFLNTFIFLSFLLKLFFILFHHGSQKTESLACDKNVTCGNFVSLYLVLPLSNTPELQLIKPWG